MTNLQASDAFVLRTSAPSESSFASRSSAFATTHRRVSSSAARASINKYGRGSNDAGEQYDNNKKRRRNLPFSRLPHSFRHDRAYTTMISIGALMIVCSLAYSILSCDTSAITLSPSRRRSNTIPPSSPSMPVELRSVAFPADDGFLLRQSPFSEPDFGGLELDMTGGRSREIWFSEEEVWEVADEHREETEPPEKGERVWHPHDEQGTCEVVGWQDRVYPTCNSFHELDFVSSYQERKSRLINGGFFRKVFLTDSHDDKVIVKLAGVTSPLRSLHEADWESNRMEAVVNNALSPNPYIVDLYSYCGLSLLSENMPMGDLHDWASPHYERCEKEDEDVPDDPWELRNSLGALEKIEFALQMAQALQVLHHHPGGAIVHNDVQLAQFLRDKNGRVKLTDFNMATILRWNSNVQQEPCGFLYKATPGSSPEEYREDILTKQIDIFNLGSTFYSLLTGVEPFYKLCNDDAVSELILSGQDPPVDERWSIHPAERSLANLQRDMRASNPLDRPEIKEVVQRLHEIVVENHGFEN